MGKDLRGREGAVYSGSDFPTIRENGPNGASDPTVTQKMAAFLQDWSKRGVPPKTVHECKRVLIYGMGTTLIAHGFTGIKALTKWVAEGSASGRPAHVWWDGLQTSAEQAAYVNGAQWFAPLMDQTHTPTFSHAASGVAPVALAQGEAYRASGRRLINAIVLGIEAECAMGEMLMPSRYKRGLGGPRMGTGAAAAVVMGLNKDQTWHALDFELITGGVGAHEQSGHMASPITVGVRARAGIEAAELSMRGLDAPVTAFHGDKGILRGYSDESIEKAHQIVNKLGQDWQILELTYNTCRGDTTTPPLIQALLEIRNRIPKAKVELIDKFEFTVDPLTKWLAEERLARWKPDTDLRATSDMPYQVASAWMLGYSPLEEKSAKLLSDPKILALRERISWIGDDNQYFLGCRLAITFNDGSRETAAVQEFHGHYTDPLSDAEVGNHFRNVAKGILPEGQIARILDTIWNLDSLTDIGQLVRLLIVPTKKEI